MRSSSTGEQPESPAFVTSSTISIRELKNFVIARFSESHPLRDVILAERDFLTKEEFIAKLETWLVLFSRRA